MLNRLYRLELQRLASIWRALEDNVGRVDRLGCVRARDVAQGLGDVFQELTDVLTELLACDRDVVHRVGIAFCREIRHGPGVVTRSLKSSAF